MTNLDLTGMTISEILAATVPFEPPQAHIDVQLTPEVAHAFVQKAWLTLHEIRALLQEINPQSCNQEQCHLEEHEIAIKNLMKAIKDKKLSIPCSPTMLLRCAQQYNIPIGDVLQDAFMATNPQAFLANYAPARLCVRARNKDEDKPAVECIARNLWSMDPTMTLDAILFHERMKPYRAGSAIDPGVGDFAGWADRTLREWIRGIGENPNKGRRGRPPKKPVKKHAAGSMAAA